MTLCMCVCVCVCFLLGAAVLALPMFVCNWFKVSRLLLGESNILQRSLTMKSVDSLRCCKGFWVFVTPAGALFNLFIVWAYACV